METGMRDYHVHYFVDGCVNDEMTLARESFKCCG